MILKSNRISRSCYYAGDLEGNDFRRLMAKGSVVFEKIRAFLHNHKPSNVSNEEIDLNCINYSRLCSLMDRIFSALHLKRGFVTTDEIDALKLDLNLVRLKWKEMSLSFMPKFHVLYVHMPDLLLLMNGFKDMGEDAIERWHQICMRHHSRIRLLQSEHKQKNNQAKHEHIINSYAAKEIITSINNKTKRNMKNTKGPL